MSTVLPSPACGQRLRLPTKQEQLWVTCPSCRHRWSWPGAEGQTKQKQSRASSDTTREENEHEPSSPNRRRHTQGSRSHNHPESFTWWQKRFPGRTFPFSCTGCGTEVQLRLRVTQSQRVCPGCGTPITVSGIDQQLDEWEPERQRILNTFPHVSHLIMTLFTCGVWSPFWLIQWLLWESNVRKRG